MNSKNFVIGAEKERKTRVNIPKEKMRKILEKAFDMGLHGYEGLKSECVDRLLSQIEKEIPIVNEVVPDVFYTMGSFGSSQTTVSTNDFNSDLNYISG